ncbi:uncharacterized protein BP01DRAFT_111043 [Aspergillus saccharolyticus JOP 1030-1]|uniref:Uncharacterized protein n=1 Tax=Aspergillus saccharolyticus JOP 1030-1 TaxID=1450539 RepID=A0A319AAS1_9EURO|nr:hypothetical protein BP01DRAFT_111043 [Aspergillus saccharolyticus JOP 1030-1]PYH48728.1 hypothetical protein BP01DRAFT_111043 [Aspergillus saccharolyticus JOP 1030-1]
MHVPQLPAAAASPTTSSSCQRAAARQITDRTNQPHRHGQTKARGEAKRQNLDTLPLIDVSPCSLLTSRPDGQTMDRLPSIAYYTAHPNNHRIRGGGGNRIIMLLPPASHRLEPILPPFLTLLYLLPLTCCKTGEFPKQPAADSSSPAFQVRASRPRPHAKIGMWTCVGRTGV